ncbi:hypothetical protein HanPSC8_Chr05g0197801 [Helianthus annuus]|nr:hypothetical protein HanPSC8_Chr05g0197801 [Helianthus annuus]
MSVRGGVRISTPQPSSGSHYPLLQEEEEEEPQMGGPSNPIPEVNSVPMAPPLGFDSPIPAYADSAAYNPFEQSAHTQFDYANVDPYQEAWITTLDTLKGPMVVHGLPGTLHMCTSNHYLLNRCTSRRSHSLFRRNVSRRFLIG